ncbi:ComF family protein [Paenibacillus chungangensis]|uniref:ComF family protein n=1 Tax=Paenibacillus chungangensis TaxID=696535 RepID=A0ABW3HKA6_9BACL
MMGTHVIAYVKDLSKQALQWLSPRHASCAVCGGLLRGVNAGTPSFARELERMICGACLQAIPWLNRITCRYCGRGISCPDCSQHHERSFRLNRSSVRYSPAMREWLARYKYRGDEALAPLLAGMLEPAFRAITHEAMRQADASKARDAGRDREKPRSASVKGFMSRVWDRGYDVALQMKERYSSREASHLWHAITYVPVSKERAEERGFNQARQLAELLADRHGMPLYHLLRRIRHTKKMSFKTRAERLRDAHTLFAVNERQIQLLAGSRQDSATSGLRILLIDDIYTTGSTASACADAMKKALPCPADIYILTWARS